jgi:hypothetical protein
VSLLDMSPFQARRILDNQLWIDPNSYGDDTELTISR